MRIQALPLAAVPAQEKADGDPAPQKPAMYATDGFIEAAPPVIFSYGTIGSSASEPEAPDR